MQFGHSKLGVRLTRVRLIHETVRYVSIAPSRAGVCERKRNGVSDRSRRRWFPHLRAHQRWRSEFCRVDLERIQNRVGRGTSVLSSCLNSGH